MNGLLIHNDNLPGNLIGTFTNTLKFNIPQSRMLEEGFSFDKEVHKQVGEALNENYCNVIFLPYSLSDNYLELTGLRLVLHIRLTSEWNHTRVPIVFIGHETPQQIAKISDMGSILFTTGVFFTSKFDVDSIQKQYDWIVKEWRPYEKASLTDTEYKSFLTKVKIDPPANYASHHSISNELSLLRWSEYTGCASEIPEVKENLQKGLYFKYILSLNPISTITDSNEYLIQDKSKIFLIDDEAEKGWKDFYTTFFNNSPNISFDYLNLDYKISTQEEIITEAIKKINDYDPDIVLLDLRLSDNDFENNINPKEFTGYKILGEIKDINQGIQVIITTASNKIWNYEPLMNAGADGYIIKNAYSNVAEDISKLTESVEKGIKRAKILKNLYSKTIILKNTKLQLTKKESYWFKQIKQSIKQNLDTAFVLSKEKRTVDFALFNYIQVLESYCKIFTYNYKNEGKSIIYKTLSDKLNNENEIIVFETNDKKIKSRYKYVKDFYPFQINKRNERDKQFINYLKEEVEYNEKDIIFSFALKLAAILDVQLNDMDPLQKLMELIFIRNNKIAHSGQNFDKTKRKINSNDLILIFSVINRLINKSF